MSLGVIPLGYDRAAIKERVALEEDAFIILNAHIGTSTTSAPIGVICSLVPVSRIWALLSHKHTVHFTMEWTQVNTLPLNS